LAQAAGTGPGEHPHAPHRGQHELQELGLNDVIGVGPAVRRADAVVLDFYVVA